MYANYYYHPFTILLWPRYFEEEDEQQHSQLEYIPAPDSPSNKKSDCDSDSSEDALDAFMEGLEKEVLNLYSFMSPMFYSVMFLTTTNVYEDYCYIR